MKHLDLLNKLANQENSFNNLDELLKFNYEFEEIPLLTRVSREDPFIKYWGKNCLTTYFLNTANYFLKTIKLYADHTEIKSQCFMLTYPDLESDLNIFGFYVPNLCIFQKEFLTNFLQKEILKYEQCPWIFDALNELGISQEYELRFNQNFEFGESSTRIYLIPKLYSIDIS